MADDGVLAFTGVTKTIAFAQHALEAG